MIGHRFDEGSIMNNRSRASDWQGLRAVPLVFCGETQEMRRKNENEERLETV